MNKILSIILFLFSITLQAAPLSFSQTQLNTSKTCALQEIENLKASHIVIKTKDDARPFAKQILNKCLPKTGMQTQGTKLSSGGDEGNCLLYCSIVALLNFYSPEGPGAAFGQCFITAVNSGWVCPWVE